MLERSCRVTFTLPLLNLGGPFLKPLICYGLSVPHNLIMVNIAIQFIL